MWIWSQVSYMRYNQALNFHFIIMSYNCHPGFVSSIYQWFVKTEIMCGNRALRLSLFTFEFQYQNKFYAKYHWIAIQCFFRFCCIVSNNFEDFGVFFRGNLLVMHKYLSHLHIFFLSPVSFFYISTVLTLHFCFLLILTCNWEKAGNRLETD